MYVFLDDSDIAGGKVEKHVYPTRVLKDIFHLMDMIKIPKRHGLSKKFSRVLRDAIFVYEQNDKQTVEDYFKGKNIIGMKQFCQNQTGY